MSFGDDDDILQDFLVEAGEILDLLSEQLVDLEQRPDDRELLNAIFRGFHTVKGGAGFLQLDAMVACCHITENLFDILRTGKRQVTPALMDVVLAALDAINLQFKEISQFEKPTPAAPGLIDALERLVKGEEVNLKALAAEIEAGGSDVDDGDEEADIAVVGGELSDHEYSELLDAIEQSPAAKSAAVADAPATSDDITDDEFEALLDQLHGQGRGPSVAAPSAGNPADLDSDEISEDEFEALLDQLHGKGKSPSKAEASAGKGDGKSAAKKTPKKNAAKKAADVPEPSAAQSDIITDDEFEALLDKLHGKGKQPAASDKPASTAPPKKESVEPAAAGTSKSPNSVQPSSAKGTAPFAKDTPAKDTPAKDTPAKDTLGKDSRAKDSLAKNSPAKEPPKEANAKEGASNAPAAETTVRVDTQRLDDIMNMVGELVLVRNRLVRLGLDSTDEALSKAVANLDVVTADLQSAVMKTRMQPIKKVFGRFPRVVRDLARSLNKEISLELKGEDTDLDKNLVEALADPLVHLVRNAVDHGIESPAARESAGKNRVGKVVLAAEQEGDHILLSITDDGAGMDPEKLRRKAVEKGILDEDAAARMADADAFNLIFAPGFSTKTEISDVSGRGVGMDVVKTKITQLNGSIEITSKVGEGSRINIKVPLTLAIMPTLMIMLEEQTFALPLVSVNEIFHMDLTKANVIDGQECVTIRNKAIPIFHLKRWLVRKYSAQPAPTSAHVVIVSVGTQRVGFVVDQLIGQEEVVIKPLGKMLHGTPGLAGATITGDGTIALILDVPSMLKRYARTR